MCVSVCVCERVCVCVCVCERMYVYKKGVIHRVQLVSRASCICYDALTGLPADISAHDCPSLCKPLGLASCR